MQIDVIIVIIGDGDIIIIIINFEDASHHSTGRVVQESLTGRKMKAGECPTNILGWLRVLLST